MPTSSDLSRFVDGLAAHPDLGNEIKHRAHLPAEPAVYGALDPPLAEPLQRALNTLGAGRLWQHQSAGLEAVRRGENVLLTTPTASGKSLVFQLPVLEEALAGGPGRALFLFPLKALGQDQLGKLEALVQAVGLGEEDMQAAIYDGDTAPARRGALRRKPPRVLITNPDMLHLGILGYADSWTPFLSELRWIVLDELHTYRGIFGSHFHHVLQRFLRLCWAAGARPQLIASSATAANAGDFAATLTAQPFTWVQESGAPREGRHLLLMRPGTSPYTSALRLFVALLEAGLKTIVFTKARRITELLFSWLRQQAPALAARVSSYRSGFLSEERRGIEQALFRGELDGVISTSALEMGIDVGGLDACVLVGYPGSMMATWQRSGRVGRVDRESLTALVALPDALDQYFLDHPQAFLSRPCEQLVVDPENEPISRAHLVCAAAERPLARAEDGDYLCRHAPLVGDLLRDHELLESADGGELFSTRRRPQRRVQLRGAGRPCPIIEVTSDQVIGTVDGVRVLHECHPGAVYLHGGRQYEVEELDLDARKVRVRQGTLSYYTTPLTEKETEVLEILDTRRDGPLSAWLGRVEVTEWVVGYERKRLRGQEVIGRKRLELPPVIIETVALWWAAPRAVESAVRGAGHHFMGALHASEHAAISLFPLLALCDRGDIGGISYPLHPQLGCGAVFIYDGYAGGAGLAQRGFRDLPLLLHQVRELIAGCDCERGCPSCIQSPKCGNGNRPLDKAGAMQVLALLLGEAPLAQPVEKVGMRLGARTAKRRRSAPAPRTESPAPNARAVRRSRRGALRPDADQRKAKARRIRQRRLPKRPERTALFDLETLRSAEDVGGWGNVHRMGVAVGVVCLLEEDRFEIYREDRVRELVEILKGADLVVGFNVKRFDYRVLNGYTGVDYRRLLPTRDLWEDVYQSIGLRLALGHLANETLGVTKSADGLQSLAWVKEDRFDLVEAYCQRDVEVTRDLYLFGRREGHVFYRERKSGRKLKLQVDW